MGVRVGGRVGPFSAGIGLSNNQLGGLFAWAVMVSLAIAAVVIAIIAAVTVAPVVAGVAALYAMGRRRNLLAALILVLAVGGGFWLWPAEYAFFRYHKTIPRLDSDTVAGVTSELAAAGYKHVRVVRSGIPGKDSFCRVDHLSPAEKSPFDIRKTVTIVYDCSPPAS